MLSELIFNIEPDVHVKISCDQQGMNTAITQILPILFKQHPAIPIKYNYQNISLFIEKYLPTVALKHPGTIKICYDDDAGDTSIYTIQIGKEPRFSLNIYLNETDLEKILKDRPKHMKHFMSNGLRLEGDVNYLVNLWQAIIREQAK